MRASAGRSVSSSSPIVAMVQPSQSSVRYDPNGGRTGSSGGWRLFREAKMSAVFVMVRNILGEQPLEMALVDRNNVIQ